MRRHNDDLFDTLAGGWLALVFLAIVLGCIFLRLSLAHGVRINSKVSQTRFAPWLFWSGLALLAAAGVSLLLHSGLPFGVVFLAYALLLIALDLATGTGALLPHDKILDPWRMRHPA